MLRVCYVILRPKPLFQGFGQTYKVRLKVKLKIRLSTKPAFTSEINAALIKLSNRQEKGITLEELEYISKDPEKTEIEKRIDEINNRRKSSLKF